MTVAADVQEAHFDDRSSRRTGGSLLTRRTCSDGRSSRASALGGKKIEPRHLVCYHLDDRSSRRTGGSLLTRRTCSGGRSSRASALAGKMSEPRHLVCYHLDDRKPTYRRLTSHTPDMLRRPFIASLSACRKNE